jgi:predicted MPP superfamily phosphohydrolase
MIAVTGDLVHDENQVEDMETLIGQLCTVAPVYYVTGNHEWAAKLARETKEMVARCGGTVLTNEYVVLKSGESRMVIAGCDDPNGYADQKTPAALLDEISADCPGVPVVLLYHRNSNLEALTGADLVLCGHGHGSPVRLSGGKLLREEYRSGMYKLENTAVCVSRGLGSSILPFRLLRSHLPVITLTK